MELIFGHRSAKRQARRQLHVDPHDANGCLRTKQEVKIAKRRTANRDCAARTAAHRRSVWDRACVEVKGLLSHIMDLERQLQQMRDQHQDLHRNISGWQQMWISLMDTNFFIFNKLAANAYEARAALQIDTHLHCLTYALRECDDLSALYGHAHAVTSICSCWPSLTARCIISVLRPCVLCVLIFTCLMLS